MKAVLLALAGLLACNDPAPAPAHDAMPDSPPDSAAACVGQLYDACDPAAPNCAPDLTCYTIPARSMSVCTKTCSLNFGCPSPAGCDNTHETMPTSGSICVPPQTNPGCPTN